MRARARSQASRLAFALAGSFGLIASLAACGAAPTEGSLPPYAGVAVEMEVSADEAWSRETLAGFNGAIYMNLVNASPIDDQLTGVIFDGAARTEIHRTVRDGDMMRMQHQAEGVTVPAGGSLRFEPGGYHVMLIDLTRDLVAGETYSATLEFEEAGRVPIEVEVRSLDDL